MTDTRLDRAIALVMRVGVTVSATLITVGFLLALVLGWAGNGTSADAAALDTTDFARLLERLGDLQPLAIVQAGLLVLIATPVVRVAVTAIGFAQERDRLYAATSVVVLLLLLASLLLIR